MGKPEESEKKRFYFFIFLPILLTIFHDFNGSEAIINEKKTKTDDASAPIKKTCKYTIQFAFSIE